MAIDFTAARFQAMTAAGPEVGAQVFSYAAGTLTPLATFTNAGGGSANANPVICDANGQADIWLTASTAYRFIVKRSVANGGATISDTDNITAPLTGGGAGAFTSITINPGDLTLTAGKMTGASFLLTAAGCLSLGTATTLATPEYVVLENTGAEGAFMRFLRTAVGFWRIGGPRASNGNDFQIAWNTTGAVVPFAISTAGDVKALGVSIVRAKAATTSRPSTTALADDPDLVVPLDAGTYAVDGYLSIWGTTTGAGGFKADLAFTGTSSSNSFGLSGFINAAPASNSTTSIGVGGGPWSSNTTTVSTTPVLADYVRITGTITVTVAGNLKLQWGQVASSANAANVGAGSYLSCKRVL